MVAFPKEGGMKMVPEQIEREILIDAPLDVVWGVVTEPEHVAGWFSDSAGIDLRPGGEAVLTWEEHGTVPARIEKVEAPNFFSFRWMPAAPGDRDASELREGNSTLVEFSLSDLGGSTLLRVVESGFRELGEPEEEKASFVEKNREGWEWELGELREYVSRQAHGPAQG
jgi:uncharacterized protein YndB with AHSA1/START domain